MKNEVIGGQEEGRQRAKGRENRALYMDLALSGDASQISYVLMADSCGLNSSCFLRLSSARRNNTGPTGG